jgi:hypothetical protein
MSERDSPKNPPVRTDAALSPAKAAEKARLAAALRANLARRKAQMRARAAVAGGTGEETGSQG